MGILNIGVELLLHDHKHKKIAGNLLSIGKQLNTLSYNDLKPILDKYQIDKINFKNAYKDKLAKDSTTRHSLGNIYDHVFYQCFSDCNYTCADISDYEGATLLHDFSKPISKKYYNKYDSIVNFSSMDNMFDPVTFLKNTSHMLKDNGRIFHLEVAGHYPGAYLMYTPEYFFSYYAMNNFMDCKVYLCVTRGDKNKNRFKRKYDIFSYSPYYKKDKNFHHLGSTRTIPETMYLMVVAEKKKKSTVNKIPMQMQFLQKDDEDWRKKYNEYLKSSRPVMQFSKKKKHKIPYDTNHFKYLGSID